MGGIKRYDKVKVDKRLKKNRPGYKYIEQAPPKNEKKHFGRNPKPVDWVKVDYLLLAGCLGSEIAPHFDMHPNTFYDKVIEEYGVSFTEYSTLKKNQGDSILRAKQYELANKGEKTMLVWLGKNRLNQRENQQNDGIPPAQDQLDKDSIIMHQQAEIALLKQEIQQIKEKL